MTNVVASDRHATAAAARRQDHAVGRRRPRRAGGNAILAGALIGFIVSPASLPVLADEAKTPVVSVTLEGAPHYPLADDTKSCGADDLPDAGVRAWRRKDGTLAVFSNAENNFPYEGERFLSLKKSCRSAYTSAHDGDPAHYADQTWVAATWTDNGTDVMAVGHHEYHGDLHRGHCDSGVPKKCRYGALLALVSHDGGASFSKASLKPIAAVPARQQASQDRPTGFAQPSNIFAWGKFKYVFVRTTGGGNQVPGSCLMRAEDPLDPASWRLYTGDRAADDHGQGDQGSGSYEPALFDPYTDDAAGRKGCKPIWTNGLVWSVLSVPSHKVLVALLSVIDLKTMGVYLATATSQDAVHWSPLERMSGLDMKWTDKCPTSPNLMYPSLIDPHSKSRNFDEADHDDVLLFFTDIEMANCRFTRDRKLVAYDARLAFSER